MGGTREGAAKVCVSNLTRLLSIATKKRSENIGSLVSQKSGPSSKKNISDKDETDKVQAMIAETLASSLIHAGKNDVTDEELEMIVEELLRMTAHEDPHSNLGKYAQSYIQTVAVAKQIQAEKQVSSISPTKAPEIKKEIQVVTLDDPKDPVEPLEELTMQDLQSLLNSFSTLSKQEQTDLINYMKKLEATNPEKVQQLKEGMNNFKAPTNEDDERSKKKADWSPTFSKKARRLSGSDLEMNPVNPDSEQESREDEGKSKWKPMGSSSSDTGGGFTQVSDHPGVTFGHSARESQGRVINEGFGGRRQEDDFDQIPLNPMYTSRNNRFGQNLQNQGSMFGNSSSYRSNQNQKYDNW